MKRYRLVNVTFIDPNRYFRPFRVSDYSFHSQSDQNRPDPSVTTPEMMLRDNRRIAQNACVEFSHEQADSIIFQGGRFGSSRNPRRQRKRKLIEDILVLGSLLTAHNWALFSRRYYNYYPVAAANHLRLVSCDETEIESDLSYLLGRLQDPEWQRTHSNGFHLIHLLNTSNVLVAEARVLSNIVIWELLYAQLFRESENLHQIVKGLLEHFWPGRVNQNIFTNGRVNGVSKNVLYVLRNQLTHSGKLPIDRPYAEAWMQDIPVEREFGSLIQSVGDYMTFFNTLTQVIALKIAGLNIEHRLGTWNFAEHLNRFLSTGQI